MRRFGLGPTWLVTPGKYGGKAVSDPGVRAKETTILDGDASPIYVGSNGLWIRVDLGASGNVVSDSLLPHILAEPSQGNEEGVRHFAADGAPMPNCGENVVRIIIEEGRRC